MADSYSHDEPIDIPNHKELNTPGKRFTDADIWWNGVGKNIMYIYYSDSTLPFISKNILSSWVKWTKYFHLTGRISIQINQNIEKQLNPSSTRF